MRYEDQWLIQRAAISYIPNLSVLQMRYSPIRKRKVLVVRVVWPLFNVPVPSFITIGDASAPATVERTIAEPKRASLVS